MATEVAVRIMAEAGALSEQFTIIKLLALSKLTYQCAAGEVEKRAVMVLIMEVQQGHAIAVESRKRFMAP